MAEIFQEYLVVKPKKDADDGKHHITIIGQPQDMDYYIATVAAGVVERYHANEMVVVMKPILEMDWIRFLTYCKRMKGGETWGIKTCTSVFKNGEYMGDAFALLSWLSETFGYAEYRPEPLYGAIAVVGYREYIQSTKHAYVYLEFNHGFIALEGQMVIELFDDICPKLCKNFMQLITSAETGKTYRNTIFHRLVKDGWMQGGDIVDGTGGNSVAFCGRDIEDETFDVKHSKRGIVGMANCGPNTIGSQFYITFGECSWMDFQYCAIGQVVIGWDLLEQMEKMPTINQRPVDACRIRECGVWTP